MRNGLRRTLDWLRHKVTMSVSWDYVLCFLRAIGLRGLHARLIENKTAALEYIPPDLRHLELFREFQLEPGFYSYQDSSAFFLLPPPRIDARDYDRHRHRHADTGGDEAQAGCQGDLRRRTICCRSPTSSSATSPRGCSCRGCSPACVRPTSSPSFQTIA